MNTLQIIIDTCENHFLKAQNYPSLPQMVMPMCVGTGFPLVQVSPISSCFYPDGRHVSEKISNGTKQATQKTKLFLSHWNLSATNFSLANPSDHQILVADPQQEICQDCCSIAKDYFVIFRTIPIAEKTSDFSRFASSDNLLLFFSHFVNFNFVFFNFKIILLGSLGLPL